MIGPLERLARVRWTQLASLQRSFASKALIALPLVAFAIAMLPGDWIEKHLTLSWRLQAVFWGALVFLTGNAVVVACRPIEFARDTDAAMDIAEAQQILNFDTFKNRRETFRTIVKNREKAPPRGLNPVVLLIAKERLKAADEATEADWKSVLGLMIVSQRALRDFDRPKIRVGACLVLATGILLLLAPTAYNTFVAATTLLKIYCRGLDVFS